MILWCLSQVLLVPVAAAAVVALLQANPENCWVPQFMELLIGFHGILEDLDYNGILWDYGISWNFNGI